MGQLKWVLLVEKPQAPPLPSPCALGPMHPTEAHAPQGRAHTTLGPSAAKDKISIRKWCAFFMSSQCNLGFRQVPCANPGRNAIMTDLGKSSLGIWASRLSCSGSRQKTKYEECRNWLTKIRKQALQLYQEACGQRNWGFLPWKLP